jgi:hypothetical protein
MQYRDVTIGTDDDLPVILDVLERELEVRFDREGDPNFPTAGDEARDLFVQVQFDDFDAGWNWVVNVAGPDRDRIAEQLAARLLVSTDWRVSDNEDLVELPRKAARTA